MFNFFKRNKVQTDMFELKEIKIGTQLKLQSRQFNYFLNHYNDLNKKFTIDIKYDSDNNLYNVKFSEKEKERF